MTTLQAPRADARASDPEPAFETLVELLLEREARQPGDVAYTFCDYSPKAQARGGAPREEVITYGELVRDARAVAADLQARGLGGHPVLLLFSSGLDFLRAYLGCILAGAHATPLRPPVAPGAMQQLAAIAQDARARAVMASSALVPRVTEACARISELGALPVLTVEGRAQGAAWERPRVGADDVALLQYTSGSTGLPKGVIISHSNLLHNEAVIRDAFGQDRSSVVVGWLPMFHDMGLIGSVLQPLFLGARGVLLDPAAFVRRPVRWLQLLTAHAGTTSGGPNFGYELCVDRVSAEEKQGLDLSRWTLAFSGAEPVRMRTLRRFHEAFAGVGFRMEAFAPCYGLAESTLFVTGVGKRTPPSSLVLDAAALAEHQARELPARGDGGDGDAAAAAAIEVTACGRPGQGQTVLIVAPDTRAVCPEGQIGEVWLRGPSTARGYLNQPRESAEVFGATLADGDGAPHLRTGDLGFLRAGTLYLTGRLKDVVIINGRNHYPHDLEATAAAAHPWLRPSCGIAFSVEREDQERLVLVSEVGPGFEPERAPQLAAEVRETLSRAHGLPLYDLVLVATHTVPKTTSGKLQRLLCRKLYETGKLQRIAQTRMLAGE